MRRCGPLTANVKRLMSSTKYWIEYSGSWRCAPMAYWVHVEQDGKTWRDAETYEPPAPPLIPHKGYQVVCFEVAGITLRFSSMEQLEEFIRVLSMKPLPTSRRLTTIRGVGYGPNTHWLSRLPTALKSTRGRAKAVAMAQFVLASTQALNMSAQRRQPSAAPSLQRYTTSFQ